MIALRKLQVIAFEKLFGKVAVKLFTLVSTENTILKNFDRHEFLMTSSKLAYLVYQYQFQMKLFQVGPVI